MDRLQAMPTSGNFPVGISVQRGRVTIPAAQGVTVNIVPITLTRTFLDIEGTFVPQFTLTSNSIIFNAAGGGGAASVHWQVISFI